MEGPNQVNRNLFFTLTANQRVHHYEPAHFFFEDEESDYGRNFFSNPYIFNQGNSLDHEDDQDLDFDASTLRLSNNSQTPKMNQNDAIKIISSAFILHWNKHKPENGLENQVYTNFTSYRSLERILSNPENYFLLNFVNFLQGEIEKYSKDYGLFIKLENQGYLDAKIDHILQTFNDLIKINNQKTSNTNIYTMILDKISIDTQKIMNLLDTNFLRFKDGSIKKTKKTMYSNQAKENEAEERKADLNQQKKIIRNLPASNQNDALKFFSTNFQEHLYQNRSLEHLKFPKFKYFIDIKLKILQNRNFPIFIKHYVDFLNLEITNEKKNRPGLFSHLKMKGYFDSTLNRILLMWKDLVTINNHIGYCEKCNWFFAPKLEFLEIESWQMLSFGNHFKKVPKTVFSQWVSLIEYGICQGFHDKKEEDLADLEIGGFIQRKKESKTRKK